MRSLDCAIVVLSMALRMCSSAQVLCITRLGSMVVVNMGDSDGSPSPPAPKRPKLGDSPQSSKFGKVRVEWNFSQTLKEIEEKTKVGDEEKRMNASPQELQLALDPLHVMNVVLPIVEKALSMKIGKDITDTSLVQPLATGDKSCWSQPWNTKDALHAMVDGNTKMWQSAMSFSSLDIFDTSDLPIPEFQNIESQAAYFFAAPTPMVQVCVGMMNPTMMRGQKVELAAVPVTPKAKAKARAPLRPKQEQHIPEFVVQPPHCSVKLLTGHVHVWAFVWAIFQWHHAGKDISKWLDAWLQIVTRVHAQDDMNPEENVLTVIEAQINGDQELSKRAETELTPATDKALLVNKVEQALSDKHKKKCSIPMASAWLSRMKWKDSKSKMDSERVIGALRKIHNNICGVEAVLNVVRQIDYMVGTQFLNADIWKQDAILQFLPVLTSDKLIKWYWYAFISLKRGDIAHAGALSVLSMRSKGELQGSVSQLGWRLEILEHVLDKFPFCEKIIEVFSDPILWDKTYPSRKQLDSAVKQGKPLEADQVWITQLTTHLDVEGEPILRKLAEGGFDKENKDKYKAAKGMNITVMTFFESGELESAMQTLQAALDKDDVHKEKQNVQQVMNLGDSSTSATGSGDSGDVVAQMSDAGPSSEAVDDPEVAMKNQIKQKAMLIRASKVQDFFCIY